MHYLPRLRREETLLFIVDIQEKLLPAMWEAERLARSCALLARAARRLEIPILVTEQNPSRLGPTIAPLREVMGENSAISKMQFSGFTGEAKTQIEASGKRSILLCGIESHVCILQTALDLIENGHTVFVPSDAVSSRKLEDRRAGWERMRGAGIVPTSTESAVFELLQTADSPDFKALLPFIK